MVERARLLIAMVAPVALVAFAFHVLQDLRWAFLLYVLGGCALVPALLLRVAPFSSRGGLPWRSPGEHLAAPAGAPLAFVLFGPVFFGVYALMRSVLTAPEPYLQNLVAYGWDEGATNLYLLLFVALVPLFEEWWWRGQFLPRAERAFGPRHGWWIAGLGFALYHIVVLLVLYDPALAILRFTGIVGAGLLWSWIARVRGSWAWVYVAHVAADLAIVVAFLVWIRPPA